ncbi:MAG: long-subunit fatty acid transport protein [Candidatus Marinamargulisbacteria bacterium]|jgi:long-subunit fatty acid transport protein
MKKSSFFIAFLCLVHMVVGASIYAGEGDVGTTAMDFMKLGHSVKSEAVGNALTAGTSLDALTLNPASIASAKQISVSFQYLSHVQEISYKNINAVVPSEFGNFAVDVGIIDLGQQTRTTHVNTTGAGTFSNVGFQILGAYANSWEGLKVGVGMKYVSQTLDTTRARAIGVDAGVHYSFSEALALGASVQNMTLEKAKYVQAEGNLPQTVRVGLIYDMLIMDNPMRLFYDAIVPNDDAAAFGFGAEYKVNDFLNVRSGYETYGDLGKFSMGLGLSLNNVLVDFTYKPMALFGQNYRVGIGLNL